MITLEWILAVLYLVGGLNDAFMDVVYYSAPLRRLIGKGRINPACEEADLHRIPEKRIAMLVPAWDESAVIGAMLESTCDRLEYSNYDIFVGTYPNDEATQMEVARAAFDRPNVHRVVCPNDGPTSKADCLNWVVEAIRLRETETGERYDIFCLEDAEDVVHPLALKVFNRFVPEYDLVQLPVIPYERALYKLSGGCYLDEFAEVHLKGLVSRLAVGGMVPSAGVGTAFSRAACDQLAEQTNHVLFPPVSLTEDYDFSFRMFRNGRKSGIAQVWVDRTDAAGRELRELVAIREFFPAKFFESVRQKQRWMLGIAFQGAEKLGWGTGWRERYMLLRDRVGVPTSLLNALALFVFGALYLDIGWGMVVHQQTWAQSLPPFYPGHALSIVIEINLIFLLNRIVQRARFVGMVATRRQMLLAPIRIVWSNVIDFYCTVHAIRRYVHSRISGEPLKWLKTAHEFPNVEALLQRHRPLGDLLLEHRFLSPADLRKALGMQSRAADRSTPLGQILLGMNVITSQQLLTVLDMQRHSRTLLQQSGDESLAAAYLTEVQRTAVHLAGADLTSDLPAELVYSAGPVPVARERKAYPPRRPEEREDRSSLLIHPRRPLENETSGRILPRATPSFPAHPPVLGPRTEDFDARETTVFSRAELLEPRLPQASRSQSRIMAAASAGKRFRMLQSMQDKMTPPDQKQRFVVAVGTRPEAIKLAPVIRELRVRAKATGKPDPVFVCASGQHTEMVREALELSGVTVDRMLAVMAPGQSLADLSARILIAFQRILEEIRPEWVIVQGDTATTAMAGLAAFYAGIRVAHVEAGLRSEDLENPFPEEFNRRMVSIFTAIHFAATPDARRNLLREGVDPQKVVLTGNTGIDALRNNTARLGLALTDGRASGGDRRHEELETRPLRVLMTAHRRENLESGIDNICRAVRELAQEHPGEYQFVWPLHPNPLVGDRVRSLLAEVPGVTLTAAVSYDRLLQLLASCDLVLTDSGGIQEEAPSFGKPVLILRETTERGEGVEAGMAWLVGCEPDRIVEGVERLTRMLRDGNFQIAGNPYGDGHASGRIADFFGGSPIEEFGDAAHADRWMEAGSTVGV